MSYAFHFGPDGIQPVKDMGEPKQPVIVGDLLAVWAFDDPRHPRYLIDGLEGGMTPIGTMEREVGAVTYRDGVLLIATREYVESHRGGVVDIDEE